MATLTAPKNKISKRASVREASEEELWEKATTAMQEMARNATALADTAAGLVQKLDAVNAQLLKGSAHGGN